MYFTDAPYVTYAIMGFNQSSREKAVKKGLISPHIAEIVQNIKQFGNSYGVDTGHEENKQNGENKQNTMITLLFRGCTSRFKFLRDNMAIDLLRIDIHWGRVSHTGSLSCSR